MSFVKMTVSSMAIATVSASAAMARDNVQIAGSSTVLPYASIVAEAFGENTDFPTPVVESGGSSAGLARFCEGIGENTIDIANASRAIKSKEIAVCAENGVRDIIEVRIGYDGIVFASQLNGPAYNAFEPSDIYTALAATLPIDGNMVANPNAQWVNVNADLPAQDILAFIPGTKHGTREVFEEQVLLQGCHDTGSFETIIALNGGDEDLAESTCMSVRADGASVDIDGDYTETLARVDANANGIGVFGLAFYENNTDALKVATMSGVVPSTQTISTGDYPVSRPLYFYIKAAHIGVIPGLHEYAQFFMADEIAGSDGPLAQYGLVADPELATTQMMIQAQETLSH